jgi:hypothetical protein
MRNIIIRYNRDELIWEIYNFRMREVVSIHTTYTEANNRWLLLNPSKITAY